MITKDFIRMNLATQPLENHSIYVIITIFILIIGLFLTVSNIIETKDILVKKKDAEKAVIELNSKIKSNEIKIKGMQANINSMLTKEFIERCDYVNMIVNKRVFSWTKLFNEFEEILPNSVRMIQVVPSVEKDEIRITLSVAAQNLESFLELLKSLETSKVFKRVVVNRESTKDQELTYELSLFYIPIENDNLKSNNTKEMKGELISGKN